MLKKSFFAMITMTFFFFVNAAEVTEVASSFDYGNPFDFNFDLQYLSTHHFGSIKREYNTVPEGAYQSGDSYFYTTADRRVETKEYGGNPELYYTHKLNFDAEIGLYKNLSISFALPLIFSEEFSLLRASASEEPSIVSLEGQNLFPAGDLFYKNKGVGDFALALQWAPFSDERKNHNFSWLIGMKVTFPTASVRTPVAANESTDGWLAVSGKNGKVGEGLYRIDLRTAISKKYEIAEPYFQFIFSVPATSSKSIYKDPKEACVFNLGSDWNWLFGAKKNGQKIKLRTDIEIYYTNKGNAYNAIADARWIYSDPLNLEYGWANEDGTYSLDNILPIEDSWVQVAAMLRLEIRIWKYIEIGGFAKFGYRHKHYLSVAQEGESGFIPGIDSEATPWLGSGDKGKLGGKLLAEEYFVLDWGFNLKLLF